MKTLPARSLFRLPTRLSLTLLATTASACSERERVKALVGVHVVPMTEERVIENQTVLIVGDSILAIGPAEEIVVPGGARRIEAAGKYLMPGLADMHAHIPPQRRGRQWVEDVMFLFAANGVTTIRGMLGEPLHLRLRTQVERGSLLGPRILTAGPSLNGESVPSPDSARRAVLHQKSAGYDFLKIQYGLSREVFEVIARTADSVGITFAGHVPASVGLARALEAGYASIDHLDGYVQALVEEGAPVRPEDAIFFGANLIDYLDLSRLPELARRTREVGVWNVPTMTLVPGYFIGDPEEKLVTQPDVRYMDPRRRRNWVRSAIGVRESSGATPERAQRYMEIRLQVLHELHEAGAGLLLGSDAPQVFNVPGFSIHEELRLMTDAGLTPYEALLAGTRNVAVVLDEEEEYGSVEQGKVADLVLLEANPLEDVANFRRLAGVFLRGYWLSGSEIRRTLEEMAGRFARVSE